MADGSAVDPEAAVLANVARHAQLADDRRFAEVGDLFTEDGWISSRSGIFRGRAAIAGRGDGLDPDLATKHVAQHVRVDVADDGRSAEARVDFVFYARAGAGPWKVQSTGRWVEHHVLDGEGDGATWRIASRTVEPD